MGFVPKMVNNFLHLGSSAAASPSSASSIHLLLHCGNFGIILLNSQWINVDGGQRALSVLEKMVEVTMMRGAQSGGVVTFEPTSSGEGGGKNANPVIKGVRSRVVNAKRTVLSEGVRKKIESDNCGFMSGGKLKGWNDVEFNATQDGTSGSVAAKRLVRGFFGHTRFATSSKASMGGTHPHQWSPRHTFTCYGFQSKEGALQGEEGLDADVDKSHRVETSLHKLVEMSSFENSAGQARNIMRVEPKGQPMGVENFVTHNGDFEFYKIGGKYYDCEAIQEWLVRALHVPMPATVDSAAIAGVIDLLRVQGCFALSVRYAVCFELGGDVGPADSSVVYPTTVQYEAVGKIFEKVLDKMVMENGIKTLEQISSSTKNRKNLCAMVKDELLPLIKAQTSVVSCLSYFVTTDEECGTFDQFVNATVNAFFDNDLLNTVRVFLKNAKGSFGLCVSTSLDAHRQVAMAAKGQTLCIAFYPRKGVICYGSEQAAVKAGLNYETPEGKSNWSSDFKCVDEDAVRFDLDDLGGEIALLDWGYAGDNEPAVSPPNRALPVYKLMGGAVNVITLHQENAMSKSSYLPKRLTTLENNEFIKPLLDDCDDPVLGDIQDIPKICHNIQEDWKDVGLNRMSSWHLMQCIKRRLKGKVDGSIENHAGQIDILVTGCEVSLWLAEQFVADLQKCFPKLYVKAVSSNKLLGLFGQELSMPSIGFPYSQKGMDLKDPIVLIISHSGGTFAPLACSNLLQSFSSSIFAVCSEWDTQVGKQLRSIYSGGLDLLTSRIFSTEVGVRPAEPCSISVVATHQLLTNIFEHICMTILGDPNFRYVTGSIINERDLQTLERLNVDNIKALERIVGVDRKGVKLHDKLLHQEAELRAAGDVWSEHILENAKAYIMTFIYIVVTVTIGHPLISGIAEAAGLRDERYYYITRFFDSLIYFWLPQINVMILRIIQGRNKRHRMVGRTVVIGDPCPWVAQSAEAFLSKIFACSYSIAGLNVLSGNPADHLVHRHTHRVVRGSLLVCGRPDGRLTALTTLEASTCLAVNQASSIQSIGGTCESITIGHNKSKLPLSAKAIFLESFRPQFLCEKLLVESEVKSNKMSLTATGNLKVDPSAFAEDPEGKKRGFSFRRSSDTKSERGFLNVSRRKSSATTNLNVSRRRSSLASSLMRKSQTPGDGIDGLDSTSHRSSAALIGAYANMEKEAKTKASRVGDHSKFDVDGIIEEMIKERKGVDQYRKIFEEIDVDGSGELDFDEFVAAYKKINPDVSLTQLEQMFKEADLDGGGTLDFEEFVAMAKLPQVEVLGKLSVQNRDDRGLAQVMPSEERYFGEELRKTAPKGTGAFLMSQSQHLVMELYESRIASMQRFVAMTVMFHQMGSRVQNFFPNISFGYLGYRMDRTHSIMRIATTASPVSGADVRDRMVELHLRFKIQKAVTLFSKKYVQWRNAKYGISLSRSGTPASEKSE
mmetsp:Transcript_4309/g.7220  ORF Transcript_4309/g.7220 Transcript_4309/m.7220 type:complete len:1456 (-) Transcript_4309:148-4515(-)